MLHVTSLHTPGPLAGVLERVQAVMVGVTTFINALITRSHLARVLVVRLCGPATRALPPFVDIPEPLHGAICAGYMFVQGVHHRFGTRHAAGVATWHSQADMLGCTLSTCTVHPLQHAISACMYVPARHAHELPLQHTCCDMLSDCSIPSLHAIGQVDMSMTAQRLARSMMKTFRLWQHGC